MRKILSVFALIAALCGCVSGTDDNVRLLYWNIQDGMWSDQGNNYDNFVEWVKSQNPDICVWCEAESRYRTASAEKMTDEEKYLIDGWEELAARYGHKYVYIGGHRDGFPQAITSVYPIENVDRIVGNADTVVFHGAGWARIKLGRKQFNFVTTHTYPQKYGVGVEGKEAREESGERGDGDIYRATEMQYVCEHTILTDPDAENNYWIMLGDFNSLSVVDNDFYQLPENSTQLYLHNYVRANTPYIDAVKETYPEGFIPTNGRKTRRIDFIYCTRPVYDCIDHIEVLWNEYTTPKRDPMNLSNFWHPSDHLPIIVDFSLGK